MTEGPDREDRGGNDGPWELRPASDLELSTGDRVRSLSRERGLADTLLGHTWWGGVGLYMRLYHRLTVHGREHLPRNAPFVLAANHASHLDAMTLGSVVPRRLRHCVYPIAAGDHFFESPWTAGFSAFVLNALPMWRRCAGRHALQQLRERLTGEPCGYLLFPEGTRSRSGEMARFKSGLGMLVAGADVPVVPCHLAGAHAALPPDRRLPRPRRVVVRVGEPLRFAGLSNDRDGWQEVASTTEAAVRALAATA